jgi:putative ABC transport system ATP-binding protein
MIEISGLQKRYPGESSDVLRGISLSIEEGEFVSLMGESGSGKTTILNVLGGLDSAYAGTVRVDGKTLSKLKDSELSRYRNETVGFVFQAFNLLEHLTCGENVQMPAYFSASVWSNEEAQKRAEECLDAVGLKHKIDHPPKLLSGGERQRVAIARALFNRPSLLLCDEPTGALDSETGAQVMETFRKLNQERGVTILVVTHSPEVSLKTRRVIRVSDGLLVGEEGGG